MADVLTSVEDQAAYFPSDSFPRQFTDTLSGSRV